jgi:outer membrane lipoprotein
MKSDALWILMSMLLVCTQQTGCVPGPSGVRPTVSFDQLLGQGGTHKGESVVLGGYILEVSNQPDASLVTVLEAPLDYGKEPKSKDLSQGRFLVRTEKFLDPEVYRKDRKLTVWGTVTGVKSEPLGNRLYPYPIIEADEIRLWPKEVRYVRPYDPFFDDYYYWPSPWYWSPYRRHPWW